MNKSKLQEKCKPTKYKYIIDIGHLFSLWYDGKRYADKNLRYLVNMRDSFYGKQIRQYDGLHLLNKNKKGDINE